MVIDYRCWSRTRLGRSSDVADGVDSGDIAIELSEERTEARVVRRLDMLVDVHLNQLKITQSCGHEQCP
jgi:hypothetical protein